MKKFKYKVGDCVFCKDPYYGINVRSWGIITRIIGECYMIDVNNQNLTLAFFQREISGYCHKYENIKKVNKYLGIV